MVVDKVIKEKTNLKGNVKTLAAVHTHTHTVYCLLVNKCNDINYNYNKGSTMLGFNSIVLSLCVLKTNKV